MNSTAQLVSKIKHTQRESDNDHVKIVYGRILAYSPLPTPNVIVLLNNPGLGIPSVEMSIPWITANGGGGETQAWAGIGQTAVILSHKEQLLGIGILNSIELSPKNIVSTWATGLNPLLPTDMITYIPGVGITIICGASVLIVGSVAITLVTGPNMISTSVAGGIAMAGTNLGMVSAASILETAGASLNTTAGGGIIVTATSKTETTSTSTSVTGTQMVTAAAEIH